MRPARLDHAGGSPQRGPGISARPTSNLSKSAARLASPRLILGLILLLAFALRIIKPDFLSLNSDEAYFVQIAHQGTFLHDMQVSEPHPPLYLYLLQWWMLAGGVTEYAIRFLSIVTGVLTVAAMYRLGRLVAGEKLALAAAFVAAANPYQILYSQTARDYELACLFGLLSFVALLKAMRQPRFIPIYVLMALAAIYSHYYAISIVALQQLLLAGWLWHRRRDQDWLASVRRWAAGDVAIALAYAPWLVYTSHALINYDPGHGTLTSFWQNLVSSFQLYNFGSAFDPSQILWPSIAVGVLVVLGLIGLASVSRRTLGFAVAYQLAPIVFGIATWIHTSQFGPRFIFLGSPGYFMVLGGAILLFSRIPFATLAPAGFVAYLAALSVHNTVLTDRFRHDDYGQMAAYLAKHAAPDDTIVLDGISQWLQYWYYAELRNGISQRVEFMPRDAGGQGADGRPVDVAQTDRALHSIAQASTGIWFIDDDSLRYDPHHDAERLLAQDWTEVSRTDFIGERVHYYSTAAAGPLTARHAPFGAMELEQASTMTAPVPAGQPLPLTLLWRATRDAPPPFKASLRLVDPSGRIAIQQDAAPEGGFADTSHWTAGTQLQDRRGLIVPVGTAPGSYQLELVAYDPTTGKPFGDAVKLQQVTIDHARPQRAQAADLPPAPAVVVAGERLAAASVAPGPVAAGDRANITLLWTGNRTAQPASATLTLGGQAITHPIGGPAYGTNHWQPNDVVRDQFTLRVPSSLTPGRYPLDLGGQPIGQVQVVAGAHSFAAPPMAHHVNARFGTEAELLGYDATPRPGQIEVKLYWQALAETDTSYTVFVHAVDGEGHLRGQVDRPPGTDNWVRNEVVTSTYTVPIDSNARQYHLEVGLYDQRTGARLPVNGTDKVDLVDFDK